MSLFARSAIGTSTDPQRASLAIAGFDQMRFTLSSSFSSMRVSLADIVHGIQLFRCGSSDSSSPVHESDSL